MMNSDRNTSGDSRGTRVYENASEYAVAVNQWLRQCYQIQTLALTFPYWIAHAACQNQLNNSVSGNTGLLGNSANLFPGHFGTPAQANAAVPAQQAGGREYVVPPLWKRVVAEIIDFIILLVLKVMITYVALDFFEFISLDIYDFELLMKNEKMDYRKAVEVTSEIVFVEVIHRFVVCIFEALFLSRGFGDVGGCTPGKNIMRLKVVSCHSVTVVGAGVIRVYPANDIGFGWALLRAFIKNFSLAFVFPMCFTMFFFQFNRTAYDIICNTIVVEERA